MESFILSENLLNIFTLTSLEVILGIDNVIFIAILIQNLPVEKRKKARYIGLSLALILRIIMLLGASWIMKLTEPLFVLYNFDFSGRTLLLIIGGLFLLVKGCLELYELFDQKEIQLSQAKKNSAYWKSIAQIIFIDLILSFDSIITAIAMTENIYIIIFAIIVAILVMLFAAETIGAYIYKYPSIKIIALAFIMLVGVMLICNGFNIEFPKAYLYSTMFFSLFVESLNIRLQKRKSEIK